MRSTKKSGISGIADSSSTLQTDPSITADNNEFISRSDFIKYVEDVNTQLVQTDQNLSNLKKQLSESKKTSDNIRWDIEEFNNKESKMIEVLGIFVALFTFISINFSFFSNKCLTPQVFITLNLVLGGFLLIFIALLRTKNQFDVKSFHGILFIVAVFLILFGSYRISYKDYNNDCRNIENQLPTNIVVEDQATKNTPIPATSSAPTR